MINTEKFQLDMDEANKHKAAFDNIYKKLPKNTMSFPLVEIEDYEWGRGEWANPYYSYFYRRFRLIFIIC